MQLIGAVLVASALVVGLTASHAGAAQLSNGTVTIRMAASGSSVGAVATTPLDHHQVVDVVVAPNSTLDRSSLEAAGYPSGAVPIKVLECADLNGTAANLPTKPTQCDPSTLQLVSYLDEDGSLTVPNLIIYALPDVGELGPSNGTVCDDGANWCVLGIFSDQNNFQKPHLFSTPFQVSSTVASDSASTSPTSSAAGASASVSIPPATLADTGGPTLWPWLLGAGFVLLVVGSTLRYIRRPAHEGRH
jgi:hypothetical protein